MEREKTVLTLNLHHFERPVCKKKKRFSQKSSVETTRSLGLIGCPSAERRSAESSWKWPLVRLVPVKLAHQLLLHGVLDGPPLPRAGLQDQQVAEVNISRHHLQTAPRGSIYDGLVLQGRRRDGVLVFIRFNRWTVNHMWLWRGETGLTWEDGSRLTFSGVNYSLLIVRKKKRKISATLTFRLVATNKTAAGNHRPFLPDFFFTAFKWKSALFCVNSLFFSSANTASKLRLLGFKKILRWKWKTDGKFTLWVHVQKKKRDEKSDMPKVKSGDLCPQKSAR